MRYELSTADLMDQPTVEVEEDVTPDRIGDFVQQAFAEVFTAVAAQGVQPAGAPYARYEAAPGGGWHVHAGVPVHGELRAGAGRVTSGSLPGGHVVRTIHTGPYDELGGAYEALRSWAVDNGYDVAGVPWESYLDDPDVPEPRTEVFLPCRPTHH